MGRREGEEGGVEREGEGGEGAKDEQGEQRGGGDWLRASALRLGGESEKRFNEGLVEMFLTHSKYT